MDELYQATVEKTEYLKRNGYNVVEMWECDMKRELEEDEAMKHYFDHYHFTDPLEPRDALYGGRTNASNRAIRGTWCTIELEKALEKGYHLLQIHEVWHFLQKTDTLFKEYIDTFAKIKLEASGLRNVRI